MMTWGHACICFFCVYVCLCVACIHVCVSVSSFACGCRCVWVYTHVRPEVNISCPPQLMSILVLESKSLTYLKLVAQWASGIHFCRHQYWGYWLVPPCLAFVWALKIWAWVPVLAQKALGQLSHLSCTILVCFYRAVSSLQVIFSSFLLSNHFVDNWSSECLL